MSTTPTAAPAPEAPTTEKVHAALVSGKRPPRPSPLAAALTFGWRGMLKIKHVPEQLIDVTITPVLFLLMFTYLFGGAVAGSTGEYLQFILPGILVQSVLFTSVYSGVALNTDVTKGVVDRFRSLPIWRPAPLVGAVLGDTVRYALAATVVVLLGLVMGFRPDAGPGGVLAAMLLVVVFAFGLSWVFTTLGLVLRSPSAVMNTGFMALFPLIFQQRVRRAQHAPGVAGGVRRRQPDLPPGDRDAGPDGRRRRRSGRRARGRGGRRAHRGVRAADRAPVPREGLSAALQARGVTSNAPRSSTVSRSGRVPTRSATSPQLGQRSTTPAPR
jgi:ABC-2 type transport system permease protein